MRYRSLSSILPWMVVHPASHKVSRVSWYSGYRPIGNPFAYGSFTFCARLSQVVQLKFLPFMPVLNPGGPKTSGLGSSLFARRYWGNRVCFLFLRVLRWFTSPGWLRHPMYSDGDLEDCPRGVAPFGNLRVKARLQLTEAYRSLPRPSSPACAKASTVRP